MKTKQILRNAAAVEVLAAAVEAMGGVSVENVRAQQREAGKSVEIWYDLVSEEGGLFEVTATLSAADGSEVPVFTSLKGDTGTVTAESVWDDGRADYNPEIVAAADGRVFAVWENQRGELASGEAGMGQVTGMEIAAGVRNANGTWKCENLTANGVLDFSPALAVSPNGLALVAWLRNGGGRCVGSAEQPTEVWSTRRTATGWKKEAAVPGASGRWWRWTWRTTGRRGRWCT